ncbi:antibiotic biosynthesis monooxygenase [Rhodovulum tesquicola]|uniref:antibiotic biosynthesis monooxygenase family protein n=1 Tax=Rhodovulum tesquicola TaxID=540254 RepID=UPI002097D814|nr:antibiotic biosynthesis monooxygenase family protein [Rhodovulum tesquicola]MCO8144378.1 antibiotic biosynthesis monooxygenase [Rhodovulum tesquicola]
MQCLFFDVRPKPGHMDAYFAHVDRLRPILARHRGLIYLERFRPLDAPDALLSHQLWADEDAITAWRRDIAHRASQWAGQRIHFESYRIRVGPEAARPAEGAARWLVAAYGPAPLASGRSHESVTRPGRFVTLAERAEGAAARTLADRMASGGADEVRIFAITRDYTMTDRAEAPGHCPVSGRIR